MGDVCRKCSGFIGNTEIDKEMTTDGDVIERRLSFPVLGMSLALE